MKIARLSAWDFHKKFLPLVASLLLITSCKQWAIDPDIQFGLIVIIAIVSFLVIFTKPIFGIYAVLVIAITFSPAINIGFTNLYFHQWLILIALLASVSSGLILENFRTKIRSKINIGIMVFVGSLLVAMSHAPNMIIGLKSFLHIGVFIASYYLVILCISRENQIKVFISILVVLTSIVCLTALGYYGSGRLGSFGLGNPNSFGNFLALVIPFCISLLSYRKIKGGKRILFGFSLILMFISLTLTFSRSAWFGVFISILFLFVLRPKKILFLLLCGIIGAVFLLSPIHKRIVKDIGDPGAQYRIAKAKIAYNKFKKNPILGNGLGSFHYEAQFSQVWAYRAHSTLENNYLLMLVEGGIIEFFAFLYLMIAFGKKAIGLLKRIHEPFLWCVLLGSITGIISTLGAGMFEDTLFFPRNNWLIGMFMGIVIVVERIYEELSTANTIEVQADGERTDFSNKVHSNHKTDNRNRDDSSYIY